MAQQPLALFVQNRPHSSRQSITCAFKCGNACFHPPANTSANTYFGDIAAAAVTRRSLLRGVGGAAVVVGAGSVLAACGSGDDDTPAASGSAGSSTAGGGDFLADDKIPGFVFDAIEPNTEDALKIPAGYEQSIVIRWGDPVVPGAPEFDLNNQTPAAQAGQFGFNNDFAGLIPIDGEADKFYLVVNQEYTQGLNMFPDYVVGEPTESQVLTEIAAHGITVLEVATSPGSGQLTPVVGPRNRRITADTEFELRGPAAGTYFTKTAADPTGTKVLGTFANCSGGITPWGTMISGEENWSNYFSGAETPTNTGLEEGWKRYGLGKDDDYHQWGKFVDRFDLAKEQQEANRFGYIVEVNPHDPASTPVKHSALGRLKHEGSNIHVTADGTVVAYTGDDSRFEYIYKFVSALKIQDGVGAAALEHNMRILDVGTLYVAIFTGDQPAASGDVPADGYLGGGTWVPLLTVDEDGTARSHVDGMAPENVAVFTRVAADKVGATKMDRPEDIEPHPTNGKVYCALTNNKDRGVKEGKPGFDAANPRNENKDGQLLEITDDHAGTTFTWDLLLVCGDPAAADTYYGGFDKTRVSPISCPDNVAFDSHGNLWISTDGNASKNNDGLFAVVLDGPNRGQTKQFLTVPLHAETCGPIITDERVIVCVQHPGENDEGAPDSHWPDGGNSWPRASVVAVWKTGGLIGT